MKELKCEVSECNATLSSPSMLATGLCGQHYKMLDGLSVGYYYAIVCWQCNQIHAIERPPFQGEATIADEKYIMIKTCPKCNELSTAEDWMNHPNRMDLSEVVLGKDETLHPSETGLQSGQPISQKLRRTQATEASKEEGQEIISKIKISKAEADERLNTFLSNLNFEEEDHGR